MGRPRVVSDQPRAQIEVGGRAPPRNPTWMPLVVSASSPAPGSGRAPRRRDCVRLPSAATRTRSAGSGPGRGRAARRRRAGRRSRSVEPPSAPSTKVPDGLRGQEHRGCGVEVLAPAEAERHPLRGDRPRGARAPTSRCDRPVGRASPRPALGRRRRRARARSGRRERGRAARRRRAGRAAGRAAPTRWTRRRGAPAAPQIASASRESSAARPCQIRDEAARTSVGGRGRFALQPTQRLGEVGDGGADGENVDHGRGALVVELGDDSQACEEAGQLARTVERDRERREQLACGRRERIGCAHLTSPPEGRRRSRCRRAASARPRCRRGGTSARRTLPGSR